MSLELSNIVASIIALGVVGVLGYVAKFMSQVDRRLTRIETLLKLNGEKDALIQ